MDSSYDEHFAQSSDAEEDDHTQPAMKAVKPSNTIDNDKTVKVDPTSKSSDEQATQKIEPTSKSLDEEATQKSESPATNAPVQETAITSNAAEGVQPSIASEPTISNAPIPPVYPAHISDTPTYQSGPAYPQQASTTGGNYQSGPAYPPPPNYQSGAGYPPPPNYQSGAGYPPPPNYQSGAGYPPPPNYQSGAGYPPPPSYQSTPSYPPLNAQSRPAYTPKVRPPKKQAAALPLWMYIGGIVLTIAVLIGLYLLGSDWAEGASLASVAALIIAALIAGGWLVRAYLRNIVPASNIRRIVSTVFLLVLVIFSGWARAAQGTIHEWQGQSLEAQQKWQQAMNEYTFAGEHEPTSVNLARTQTSWGVALQKSLHYNDALTKFTYVIDHFGTSTSNTSSDSNHDQPDPELQAQITRAQTASIDTRITMAQQSIQAKKYNEATNILDPTLNLPYCDSGCKKRAQPLDATSYYQIGSGQLQDKKYSDAITSFNTILNSFPDAKEAADTRTNMSKALLGQGEDQLHNKNYSDAVDSFNKIVNTYPYPAKAKQIHGDLSKAILGQGQTTRASSCTDSVTYYKQLAKDYKDTPEGQKAQQELNVPQNVSGQFVNTEPSHAFSQMGLVQGLHGNMPQGELFNAWGNAPYKTDIQANGNFAFQGIPQGSYDLMWYGNDGTAEYVEFIYTQFTLSPKYVANVGPLCSVNMGKVTNVTGYTTTLH
ncbi:hypothetical protein KDW_43630 [Dictyobacter vulcani]|uniref:Uncharacterized protein n=1 Tax=Dictyobacter vulcani TaxID=2607529 RepID=A0A5J4KUK7_9CHLR|nr:tetratricopeptide repeat protein [Dictyobacter vulcani]GER90201.1 hypothetical protein KDW_43630 [Dictyobacter vulcani]